MSGGVAADAEGVGRLLDRLAAMRARLAEDADPQYDPARPFSLTVLHPAPTERDLERMGALGVERVVVMPWARNAEAPAAIERFMAMARGVVPVEGSTAGA